jgi:hypothetical protein
MTLAYLLVALMVLIGLAPMMWEIKHKKFDFFNLKNPFILYFVIQLALSGLITFSTRQASEIGLDPVEFYGRYLQALLLSAFALLLFQIGYYTRSPRSLVLPNVIRRPWGRKRHLTILIIYFLFGFLCFALLLAVNGGFSQFMFDREEFRAGGMIGQGILIFPATSLLTTAALVYFLGQVRSKPNLSVIWPIIILLLSIVPAYFIGFRSVILLPVLQFMVVWHYSYRPIPIGKIVSILSLVVVVYTYYGFSREIPPGVSVDTEMAIDIVIQKPELLVGVFSRSKGTEVVASVINTLEQTGEYDLGWKSVIEAVTILIPRAIWEDKPMASSQRFTTYFFGRSLALSRGSDIEVWGGISPTMIGELYWNFGLFGVLVGLFFMGRVSSIAYFTLRNNLHSPSLIIIYAVFFTTFAMFAEAIQGYFNSLVMHMPLLLITFSYLNINKASTYRSV